MKKRRSLLAVSVYEQEARVEVLLIGVIHKNFLSGQGKKIAKIQMNYVKNLLNFQPNHSTLSFLKGQSCAHKFYYDRQH
jgi:hypothetical protein